LEVQGMDSQVLCRTGQLLRASCDVRLGIGHIAGQCGSPPSQARPEVRTVSATSRIAGRIWATRR
jgi:hypothetical protein